jgi:uncharacterized protein YndB with AHSA1/START domain
VGNHQHDTVIEKSIDIRTPASRVWQVFTDPTVTRHLGGEYVSDWKVSSSFGWKGLNGTMLTHGTILQIQPEKILQHHLFEPDRSSVISSITYTFQEKAGHTTLLAQEEFVKPLTETVYAEASEGWDVALQAIKEVTENIER